MEGTVPVPHTAPALCDNDVLPFEGLLHFGGEHFPWKLNYSGMIQDFLSPSSMHDDRRRSRKVAPAVDQ